MTNRPQSSESPSPEPTPRRRFMTRAVVAVLTAGAISGVGARAFAHGWGGGWHHGGFNEPLASSPSQDCPTPQLLGRASIYAERA